jgi:type I restriction enzyme S subunit
MSGWAMVPLGEAVELVYGKSLPKYTRASEGKVPVYGSNGVAGWHDVALVNEPTVIVGRKGSAGAVQYVDVPCYPIDTTYFVRVRRGFDFDTRFLFYLLSKIDLSRLKTATGVPGLTREDAYRETIPVPPLTEQRRIVDLLARAEGILLLRREAQKKAAELTPALFLDMFGDPVGNSKCFRIAQLGEFLSFITSGSRGWARYYASAGVSRFIRSLDVRMNSIADENAVFVNAPAGAEAERTRVQAGDVLLTITGSRIGRVAAIPEAIAGAFISQHVAILRLKAGLSPIFLSMFLSMDSGGQQEISRLQYGQTKPGLNLSQIREFRVPIPPLLLQEQFVHKVESIRAIETQQVAALQIAKTAFDALLEWVFGAPPSAVGKPSTEASNGVKVVWPTKPT